MKKILWGILAFMLVFGLAGALAGGGQEEGAAPEAAEQVELILWGSGNLHPPEGVKKDDAAIYKILAKIERENPNIRVELIIQPAKQLLELFRAANAAKSGPDVIRLFGGSVNEYIQSLLPLNNYFTEKELDKYMGLEYTRENYALSGPVYAIPADSYVCLPYYNKDVWAKAGFGTSDIPETWDELLALSEKFKQQGVIAMFQGVKDGHQADFMLSHLLANFVGPDGVGWLNKLETFAGSEFEKAAEYAQAFVAKGYSNEDALSITLGEAPGRFFQAGAAMMYHGNWELKNLQAIMGDKLGMFKMPPADPSGPFKDYHYAGAGSNTAIANYTKHPDEAAILLKELVNDEFQAAIFNQKGLMPNNLNFDVNLVEDPIGKEIITVAISGRGATVREIFPPKLKAEVNRLSPLIATNRISPEEVSEILDRVLKEIRSE